MQSPSCAVILAGVVPPPVHGASLATRALFDADLSPISKNLLEIRSSQELQQVGKASLRKVFGLLFLVLRCIKLRISSGARVLYYTPGSANFVPFVRDIVFLGLCRWMFRRTVLHYHSGGLSDYLNSSSWRRFLGSWIYGRQAWAVTLSKHVAVPGADFGAARLWEVPNGLDVPHHSQEKPASDFLRILFLGNLYEDKGIFDLLLACQEIAKSSQAKIQLQFVGKWPDQATEEKFHRLCQATESLTNLRIPIPKPLYGDDKWKAYAQSDLFVFPSYYQSENFPLVLLEAMANGLPIISTRWRGIPSIVQENKNGLLHEPKNLAQLSDCIRRFVQSPELLEKMGCESRNHYREHFTFERHRDLVISVLKEACDC